MCEDLKMGLLHLVLVHLFLVLGSGVLVLLVLGNEIVHVGLSLSELHLIHTFSGIPMEEGLSSEHSSELLANSLEHLLDGSRVSDEGGGHLETLGRDVTNGGLDVVGDPLDEVRRVLVLNIEHLLINFLGGHSSSEHGGSGKVSSVSGVRSAHHVLGVEHLLGELGDGESSVLLGSSGGEGGESDHEEVESGEGDKVNGELSKIGVKLSGESEAASDTGDGGRHEMVEITVSGGGELEGSEADIVEGLVIDDHNLIGVLNELMDGEGSVVRLNNGIRNLGGGEDGEGLHDSVGVLFSDLRDEEGSHTGTGSSSHGVSDLESLEAVAALSFLSNDIEDGVDELGTLSVVSLSPVVSGTRLSEDEVVGSEELTEGSGSNGIHSSGFEIHKDGSGDVSSTSGLVVVDVDSLELEIGITVVGTSWVDAVLVGDDLPELSSNLVTALTGLNVNDFSHI